MKINRCVACGVDFETQDGFRINVCNGCETRKEIGFPTLRETVSLHTMQNVSKARLAELDKRVMLPDTVKGKDYVCGSRQNGKITDRQLDLT